MTKYFAACAFLVWVASTAVGLPPGTIPGADALDTLVPGRTVEERALHRVNQYRGLAGLEETVLHRALTTAARSHARYLLRNDARGHLQDRELPGFVGVHPWDRTQAVGYPRPGIWEDVHYLGDPVAAVDGWMDSVYHRLPILMPRLLELGYATSGGPDNAFDVMKFSIAADPVPEGESPGDPLDPVLYPAPDQFGVPTSFGGEAPNPRPDGSDLSGYPITLIFDPTQLDSSPRVLEASVSDASGRDLELWVLDPSSDDVLVAAVALIPRAPLVVHERYTVHVVVEVPGVGTVERTWSFTTGPDRSVAFLDVDPAAFDDYSAAFAHVLEVERVSFLRYLSRLIDVRSFFSTGAVDPLWDRAVDLGAVNHAWTMHSAWASGERRTTFRDETAGIDFHFVEEDGRREIRIEWNGSIRVVVRPEGVVLLHDSVEFAARSLPELVRLLEPRL